jgi:3-oxoacyl-[acyl-carrier protein] reductase
MQPDLKGKRALVTGGTRGIGYAIAEALAACGCSVAICGTRSETVQDALKGLRVNGAHVVGKVADVKSRGDVAALFGYLDEELGGLDILVNNAGVGIFLPVAELTDDDWRTTMGINLDGVFFCSKEAVTRMKKAGGGFIINIGSLAGRNAFAGGSAYNASKFGLLGFSEALMLDHRQDNIRVSTVMPGSVNTGFSPRSEQADWKIAPEDVAQVVLNLLAMPERTLISRIEMRPSRPPK